MTTEQTMTRLLEELADEARGPDLADLQERLAQDPATKPSASATPVRRQWWLAAAALLAVVVGIGSLRLAAERSESVALTPASDSGSPAGSSQNIEEWFTSGSRDFVVWIEPSVTAAEFAAVETSLQDSDAVDSFRYVSTRDVFAEFQQNYSEEPEILDAVGPEQLPSRFEVTLRAGDTASGLALIDALVGTEGVADVALPVLDGPALPPAAEIDWFAGELDLNPEDRVELRAAEPNLPSRSYVWTSAFEIDGLPVINIGRNDAEATQRGIEQDEWTCRGFVEMTAIQCTSEPGPAPVQLVGSSAEIGAWVWTNLPEEATAVIFVDQNGKALWQEPIDRTVVFADTETRDQGQRCACMFIAIASDEAIEAWQY